VCVCVCVCVFVFPHALSPKVRKGFRRNFVFGSDVNAGRIDCGPSMKFCLMEDSKKYCTIYKITYYRAETLWWCKLWFLLQSSDPL
jgi:hypothetical protein